MAKSLRTGPIVLAAAAFALPAAAQDRSEEGLLDRFEQCQALQDDDAARLACYDAAVIDARRIVEATRERERVRTVEDFGLTGTQIDRQEEELAETDPAEAEALRAERQSREPDEIRSTVMEIFSDRRSGKRLFILENGQIWREALVSRMQRNPRVDAEVSITRTRFGGFRMRVDGKKGYVEVRRVK